MLFPKALKPLLYADFQDYSLLKIPQKRPIFTPILEVLRKIYFCETLL